MEGVLKMYSSRKYPSPHRRIGHSWGWGLSKTNKPNWNFQRGNLFHREGMNVLWKYAIKNSSTGIFSWYLKDFSTSSTNAFLTYLP